MVRFITFILVAAPQDPFSCSPYDKLAYLKSIMDHNRMAITEVVASQSDGYKLDAVEIVNLAGNTAMRLKYVRRRAS
jgi:hypothetical protein